ncbi:S41 family peptidase [Patescibacteria group bacterium]|nr:S41 family peptidase [Patescibacteria group bacterium]
MDNQEEKKEIWNKGFQVDSVTLAVGAFCFLAVGFFIGARGISLPFVSASHIEGPEKADMTSFYRAWEILDTNFAPATTTVITKEEKVWGAISGLAASYGDPYTVFLPPREKEIFESEVQGNFGGVGMEIDVRNGVLTVVAPLKDTPAFRAGIKSGDVVLQIDGKDTKGLRTEEAVGKIRGPEGTDVKLKIAREGEAPFEITITREQINLPTVDTELRPDGVFVIKLYSFNANAPEKFRNALREFANSGTDKMLIDVRGNPGGYLEVAVDLASWFLPVGKQIVIQDFSGEKEPEVFRSRGYDVFNSNLKLAILQDEGSASAAEIFAGALHDHGKATLIGRKSFGKGSVQQIFDVTSDSSLKITIAQWLTPNGVSISHEGIKPEIDVEITKEDIEAKRDPQLERAAEFLKTGK